MCSRDYIEAFCAVLLVRKELDYCLTRQARLVGLSLLELQVLWIALRGQEVTFVNLAKATTYSKETLRPVVHALETDGLLQCNYCEKTRKRTIKTTEEGRALLKNLQADIFNGCVLECKDLQVLNNFTEQANQLVRVFRGDGDYASKPVGWKKHRNYTL